MRKKIHVDFYSVESNKPLDLPAALVAIHGLKPETSKNMDVSDSHVVRLQNYRAVGDLHEINMLRIRMDQVPMRASIGGGLAPFLLKDDEGIGEQTAMLYEHRLKLIAFQRNRYGVSPSTFAFYLKHTAPNHGTDVELLPVLQPDALKKMQRMVEIRSMDVRVSGVVNTAVFGDQVRNYAIPAVNKLLDDFKAPSVSITMSVGKQGKGKRSPLLVSRAKDALTHFLGLSKEPGGHIQKLGAIGKDEDGNTETINLLKAQLTTTEEVDAKNQRVISLDQRLKALHTALGKNREDLESMLVRP